MVPEETGVDAVLIGEIYSYYAVPTSFDEPGRATTYEVFIRAKVALADLLENKILYENKYFEFTDRYEFEGDESFVYGFGTRATFYEQGKVKLGALFQMNWGSSDGEVDGYTAGPNDTEYSFDVDTLEWAIAVGINYQLNETVALYGGPFLYILDGEVTAEATWFEDPELWHIKDCYDLEAESTVGGYFGANFDLSEDLVYNVEWLHTHDSDALAMMIALKF